MNKNIYLLMSIILVLLFACNTDTTKENTNLRSGRISVRDRNDNRQEFYDTETNKTFIPMGFNFTDYRLYKWNEVDAGGHSTFNEGVYDHEEISAMMNDLNTYGYNTVRVFLDPLKMADEMGELEEVYMSNVSDFITTADDNSLAVIITMDLIPVTKHNVELNSLDDFTWANYQYINQDEIDLEKDFWSDFITSLIENKTPLKAILAYELRNEFAFDAYSSPFYINDVLQTNDVTNAQGNTYSLSNTNEVENLLVDSFKYWSKSVRDEILKFDENALVTVGFYANFYYLDDALRKPVIAAINDSELDFIDLHMYPGEEKSILDFMKHFELETEVNKPIILGEFGIVDNERVIKPNKIELLIMSNQLKSWKDEIMNSYGFDGWLVWTWQTENGLVFSIEDDKLFLKELSPLD